MYVVYTHPCVHADMHTRKRESTTVNKMQTRTEQLPGSYFYLVERRELCIVNDNFIFFIEHTERLSRFPGREHNNKLRKSFVFIKK